VDGRDGDPPVGLAGGDFVGVKARRLLQEAGEAGILWLLVAA